MNARIFTVVVAFFVSAAVPSDFNGWSSLRHQIQSSAASGNAKSLHDLAREVGEWDTEESAWKHYWQAYIAFRLIDLERNKGQDARHLHSCKDNAEAAIAAGETSGESHALLASCLGRLAAVSMAAGMRYGIASGNAQDESILEAPDNPRVLILAAVSDYNKPVMWGGDIDRAERRLRKAVDIFQNPANHQTDPWLPQWGLIDAYGHLAIVLDRLNRKDDALTLLDRAEADGVESPWLDRIEQRIQNADG